MPQHGSTSFTNSTVLYIPNSNYNGTDQLTYRLSDGYSGVSTGIVSIIVRPVNDPPVVHLNQAQVQSDRLTEIPIQVADPDNTNFTYVVTQPPSNGVVSISPDGSHMFYRSRHLFVGTDSLTFTVSDGTTNTAPLTQVIRVLVPTDLDRDGMADAWETDFDLNNPAGDRDSDGMSNLAEYQAGTSPIDPESIFKILSVLSDNNGIRLSWRSVGGVRYRVMKSPDLSPGSFAEIVRPIGDEIDPAPYGRVSTNSFLDVKGQSGFYSLKVVP